jgi:hypothetical protein
MIVLAVWPAVDPQHQRVFLGGIVRRRFDDHPVNFRAVFTPETDVLDRTELPFRNQLIVLDGKLSQFAVFQGIDLFRAGIAGKI